MRFTETVSKMRKLQRCWVYLFWFSNINSEEAENRILYKVTLFSDDIIVVTSTWFITWYFLNFETKKSYFSVTISIAVEHFKSQ